MLPPLPRCSSWASSSLISPSRISLPRKGCRVGLHIVLFEACSAFTHVAACTLARSPIRDPLTEGFRHFVTSMPAPVASGWSGCRVGLAPTGKAPPCHGAPPKRTFAVPNWPSFTDRSVLVEPLACGNLLTITSGKQGTWNAVWPLSWPPMWSATVVSWARMRPPRSRRSAPPEGTRPRENRRAPGVKVTGDALLVEFPSVVNAVACAAEIQRKMLERNADVPETAASSFVWGQYWRRDSRRRRYFRDRVNVAARLEGFAKPGGISLSGAVRDHLVSISLRRRWRADADEHRPAVCPPHSASL